MWLFGSGVVLIAYTGINIYTGIRVLALLKYFLPSFKAFLFWPIYFLLCYSFILLTFFRSDWVRPFRLAAMSILPAVFYLFLALLFLDGLRLFLQHFGRIPRSKGVM
jgi:hypothetical protein